MRINQTNLIIITSLFTLAGCNPVLYENKKLFDKTDDAIGGKIIILQGEIPADTTLGFYVTYSTTICTKSQVVTPGGSLFSPEIIQKNQVAGDEKMYPAAENPYSFRTELPLVLNDKCRWSISDISAVYNWHPRGTDERYNYRQEIRIERTGGRTETQFISAPQLYYVHFIRDNTFRTQKESRLEMMEEKWNKHIYSPLTQDLTITFRPAEIHDFHATELLYYRIDKDTGARHYSCTVSYPDGTVFYASPDMSLTPPAGAIINREADCRVFGPDKTESHINTLMKRQDDEAKMILANMYSDGKYLPADCDKAKKLYTELVKKGNKEAEANFNRLMLYGACSR